MSSSSALKPATWAESADSFVASVGHWLSRHQRAIGRGQWLVVLVYLALLAGPIIIDLPPRTAHIWSHITLFAQFAFWGIWWPFVLLSMVLVGRSWCGIMCPEGALSEAASRYSLGRHVPRWITWSGWPFLAFALTTIYGQMVSVYQYPKPVLAVLGGSTVAAIAVALVYGRNKRVWCRYLCPVNGVFAVLAKIAPVAFQTDEAAWKKSPHPIARQGAVNCAPLVPLRTMKSASPCHMCGRCDGFRGSIRLGLRSPNHEIVNVSGDTPNPWETVLILFGMMGVALGAFHWTTSPWFIDVKQGLAELLVEHGVTWPLEQAAPWFVLTNYPAQNDVMSLLDGFVLLSYILGTAIAFGGAYAMLLAISTRVAGPFTGSRFHHLAQAMIPMAGCGVFLGLFSITVSMLKNEGVPVSWVPGLQAVMLSGAATWSIWLSWRVIGLWATGTRRMAATSLAAAAAGLAVYSWALLFWIW